ncbi:hypothetical protein BDN72DRAFT_780383 [Pluteus cervinus]|uniref:Uncharacterized protein n=1 Tax=Pluteus cervinus TaxID=181527 RepID=A0ACD3A1Z3_9AGAR|nr:hypothetical protein BDN72DRAFT_780383 [Pluteus cervinus]
MPFSAVSKDPFKQPEPSYKLIPAPHVHHRSNLPNNPPVVAAPRQKVYTQNPRLPPVHGQAGFITEEQIPSSSAPPSTNSDDPPFFGDDAFTPEPTQLEGVQPSQYQRKKLDQWNAWKERVLPALSSPFLQLFARTKSFANFGAIPPLTQQPCSCSQKGKSLEVNLLGFLAIAKLNIRICKCTLAATQLLSQGYFPCSPVEPTLAVDVRVLEFVMRLFSEMAPNHTAFTQALEGFLSSMGHKLEGENSLRRRFMNAYRWYTHLKANIEHGISTKIHQTRCETVVDDNLRAPHPRMSALLSETPSNPSSSNPSSHPETTHATTSLPLSTTVSSSKRRAADHVHESPFPEPRQRSRPSEYLRQRCPACFGGEYPPKNLKGPYVNVAGDACFTQKRNKGKHDPLLSHPDTVFIPEEDVLKMQEYVEGVRLASSRKKTKATGSPSNATQEEDATETGMKLPSSVLDGCEASFTAADERCEKASTQFFEDTGLMALLCSHDRVLWLVNMRSAGEKQYYMLALLEMLFQHLPLDAIVGFLYDVSCALHRSCVKWGFLKRYMHRIVFGVSVFHAFGHQWPCQLIYHPRKCVGFGLRDGEGTERFWSSLRKLIAPLRVSGSHQRRYTLDLQVHYDLFHHLSRLGRWLYRRMLHYRQKRQAAEVILKNCGHAKAFLRREWDDQVKTQTQPLPRRSQNAGRKAVEETLRLRTVRDSLKEKVDTIQRELVKSTGDASAFATITIELQQASNDLQVAERRLQKKQATLGLEDERELRQLIDSKFLQLRINALALKARLRDKLRSRKFELDRVEREFRKQRNDQKVDDHTKASVERRDPSIQQLARTYNELCASMVAIIRSGEAPPGAQPLTPLATKGLFKLDVDDSVWRDLDMDMGDVEATPPLWSSTDSVRNGIAALLECDRCDEEESRICHERRALQVWFSEEWTVLSETIKNSEDSGEHYYLGVRRKILLHLHSVWSCDADNISAGSTPLPEWGPSPAEAKETAVARVIAGHGYNVDSDDEDEQVELDMGMIATLDMLD